LSQSLSKKLNRCAWCGTWSPLQRPVFAHTAQQVAPSLQEHHIAQVLPDPEVNDDGAIDEVITDESDDEESPLANLPVTRGAFINSYSEANRVVGTFSSIPDLVAAVAVSWTSCEAVQPLLSKAVMANGGHVDGFTVIPNPPEAVAPTAPTAIFGGGITGETIIEGSGVYGGGTFEDSFTWLDELLSDHWLQQAIESVQWCRKSATDLFKLKQRKLDQYRTFQWTADTVPLDAYPINEVQSLLSSNLPIQESREILFARHIKGMQVRSHNDSAPFKAAHFSGAFLSSTPLSASVGLQPIIATPLPPSSGELQQECKQQ